MKKSDKALEANEGDAIISFIRDQSFAKEMTFGIWSKDRFLGNLKGETFFQITVPEGKHLFFGKAERWSVLEADVEAGKKYYVHVTVNMGWTQALNFGQGHLVIAIDYRLPTQFAQVLGKVINKGIVVINDYDHSYFT